MIDPVGIFIITFLRAKRVCIFWLLGREIN